MSRVLKEINIPSGVEIVRNGNEVTVKGAKGQLNMTISDDINMVLEDGCIRFEPKASPDDSKNYHKALPLTGTVKSLCNNMITGVTNGFEKKLTLVGVGYRTSVQGNVVNLNLGFSHPIAHHLPEGISAEATSQTELVIRGIDKQAVGQVAANIRAYRPPEPYKGKGIRYADEYVARKESKKK